MSSVTNIYVLRLKDGKYYVGKTKNVTKRYQEHLSGTGSSWTRKYKPLSLEKVIPNASRFEEDKITKEYMHQYGIDKVRGGSYVTDELSDFQINTLNIELWGATDKCTRCGRQGHFIKDCYAGINVNGKKISTCTKHKVDERKEGHCKRTLAAHSGYNTRERTYTKSKVVKRASSSDTCYRCGRPGHRSPDCYASRDIDGRNLGYNNRYV